MLRMSRKGRRQLEQAPWLWLCVVPDLPPGGRTRTFWTVKENGVQTLAAHEDQFWLGVSDPAKDRRPRSAADRVAALFRHGTPPVYTMPVLTRSLTESIWVAFSPARRDRFPAAAPKHLLHFLIDHRGGIAFVREAGGPDTGEYDEELNRLMRESHASQLAGVRVAQMMADRPGDDEPGDDGEGGVREPRRPLPGCPPVSAAVEPDEDEP